MKRRAALAAALTLTTMVGFFIVAYGTQVGFFGLFGGSSGDEALASDSLDVPAEAPAVLVPTPLQVSAPEPQVIDQYYYEDVFVPAQGPGGGGGGSEQGTPEGDADAPANPTPAAQNDDPAPQDTPEEVITEDPEDPEGPEEPEEVTTEDPEEMDRENLEGKVVAVGDGTFTLTGTRFGDAVIVVTSDTEYRSEDGGSLTFAEIQVGIYLKTKVLVGRENSPTGPDGSWVAVRVEEEEEDD